MQENQAGPVIAGQRTGQSPRVTRTQRKISRMQKGVDGKHARLLSMLAVSRPASECKLRRWSLYSAVAIASVVPQIDGSGASARLSMKCREFCYLRARLGRGQRTPSSRIRTPFDPLPHTNSARPDGSPAKSGRLPRETHKEGKRVPLGIPVAI